jgi:hypothetical protein
MTKHAEGPRIAAYERKLRWALSALPDADRDGILDEMRSHVLDRVDAGASVQQTLEALGDPNEYARRFCDAYNVASALSSRRTPHLVGALVGGLARSLTAAFAALVILAAWSAAALIAYVAVLKIGDPAHVGLWRGPDFFFIGIVDNPATGQELLGPWITPLALVVAVGAWIATRILATWALSRLTPLA